ncbi:hypothetical protein OIU85_008596 [Salix viminalis]|uniref:Uncharacterized protein n=1 Tax=Salix viminalis TaxID=40686 RepID=A0A9Q0NXY9_SALVM|nr:hypothetical protein OIU85_008596 [Salix viminalis]
MLISLGKLLAAVRARRERGKENRRRRHEVLSGDKLYRGESQEREGGRESKEKTRGVERGQALAAMRARGERQGEKIEGENRVERGHAPRRGESQGRERVRKSKVRT